MTNTTTEPLLRSHLGGVTLLLLLTLCTSATQAKRLSVLEVMHLTNDYFIRQHPDAGAPTFVKKERPSNLWTRGVYFEGLCALNAIDPKPQNTAYIMQWANAHKWTPRNGIGTRDADDYCCSQSYLDLYEHPLKGEQPSLEWINPTVACMENLIDHVGDTPDPENTGKFNGSSLHDWFWIDAIQMGLPVLTRLARIQYVRTGDPTFAQRYADQGWNMYVWSRDTLAGGLFNKAEGLWWRDADFVPPYREPNGRNCYWSRGNGWVYAALVRAMDDATLANGAKAPWNTHYDAYLADYKAMTEALVACQRSDCFWNVSLHDQSNFGGPELSGTALFIYGMAWGVRHGVLPAKKYMPIIRKTWNAMVKTCVHTNGFLGYVQGTGKEPKDSQPVTYTTQPDFDDYGLGCLLLCGSELYLLGIK